jgi:hypothetical protein
MKQKLYPIFYHGISEEGYFPSYNPAPSLDSSRVTLSKTGKKGGEGMREDILIETREDGDRGKAQAGHRVHQKV